MIKWLKTFTASFIKQSNTKYFLGKLLVFLLSLTYFGIQPIIIVSNKLKLEQWWVNIE